MFGFVVNSILLGVGLAMDAFSVSIANGLNEPGMRRRRVCAIAGVYAFFQFLMPVVGWFCVHELVQQFRAFEPWIPWIALALLLWIGGKMLLEGIRGTRENRGAALDRDAAADHDAVADCNAATDCDAAADRDGTIGRDTDPPAEERESVLTVPVLLLQGIATAIDALSVGFAIAGYTWLAALICALIIAAVTFVICVGGLAAGKRLGEKLAGKAGILGGCILIFIGLEIFVRGVFL